MAHSMTKSFGQYTQGVGVSEILAGALGVVATAILPRAIIKNNTTTTGKLLFVGVGVASAVGAGMIAKRVTGQNTGKFAVCAGLAAVAIQAVPMFTSFKLTGSNPTLLGPGLGRRLGEGVIVSPSFNRQDEQVGMIQP